MEKIEELREKFRWGTCGKFHKEPLRYILLKDISDSHLSHIIPWIINHPANYFVETLLMFQAEQKYRVDNYIFVKDYEEQTIQN